MTLTWNRNDRFLLADDRTIECWSKVRNELNQHRPRRGEHDVCINFNRDGDPEVPIMPRPFPCGEWEITGFKEHPDPTENGGYLYPIFIRTNAVNLCHEWKLDENGFYLRPTGRMVEDHYNGLHFSTSDWTQGCLRIGKEADVRWLWEVLSIGDELIVSE